MTAPKKSILESVGHYAQVPIQKARFNVFGKAERLAAGVCMGIPFFLLIGDEPNRPIWYFPLLALFFIVLPYGIIALTKRFAKTYNYGLFLTSLVGAILIGFYFVFIRWWEYESRPSISQYVSMHDSYIFGLLLTTGAMLFMANGLIYWQDVVANRDGKRLRAINNFWLGLFLFGVVVFPCIHPVWYWPHYGCAVLFFVGCAIASIFRSTGQDHSSKHKKVDYSTAALMIGSFVVPLLRLFNFLPQDFLPLINLFGAESIGLWVIGVDFILVSLDRDAALEKRE